MEAEPIGVAATANRARAASRALASAPSEEKDRALHRIASLLDERREEILLANAQDVAKAREDVASGGLAQPLLNRLILDASKIADMSAGVLAVASLPDPTARVLSRTLLDDGLELHKVSCPIGVLAVIFESRPDAVIQIGSLAIKSGNAAILKGGREATRTNRVLVALMQEALAHSDGLPPDTIQAVEERTEIEDLLSMDTLVDLVIPRGSNALVRHVMARTRIPVLGHAEGICHVYLDADLDPEMGIRIVLDSKLQYVAACNTVETVLIHEAAAPALLGPLVSRLVALGVEVRGCERTQALIPQLPIRQATEEDWRTEYSAKILSIRVVSSLDDAIEHINRFGSGHTDTIVTRDRRAADEFLSRVDSAGVFHNASTRFADGFRYGFGAEVGVATSKLHARGPVGLEGLVSYKYKLYGTGQIVATYAGPGARRFRHQPLQ